MKRVIGPAAFLLWAGPLAALDVPVQSGEHGDFTRLSLALPATVDWSIGRLETGYQLQVDDAEVVFQLGEVFNRIGRVRVSDLSQSGDGELRIELGCDCHLVAFRFREIWLILDVRDGPAPADSPFEDLVTADIVEPVAPPPTNRAPAVRLPVVFGHAAVSTREEEDRALDVGTDPDNRAVAQAVEDDGHSAAGPEPMVQNAPDLFAYDPEMALASEGAEAAIAESIARAVSQGLLSPTETTTANTAEDEHQAPSYSDPNLHTAPDGARPEEPVVPDHSEHVPEAEESQAQRHWPGIAAESSIDRERPTAFGSPGTLEDRGGCLPESYFALQDWGDDRDFPTQVAERRAALSAEFDLVPEGAPLALARTYVYFGFGREAKRALEIDGVGSQERSVLLALAALVDGEPVPFPILDTQIECDGSSAMWGLLSVEGQTHGNPVNTVAIRKAFRDLPEPLQGHVGNRLSEALVAAGEVEVARLILERSEPAVTGATPEADIVRAEIAVADHDTVGARATLDAAIHSDIRMPPEAILRLFDLAHEDGTPVDESILVLSEAYRFENRGARLAVDLAEAEMRARFDLGQIDVAFGLIDEIAHDVSSEELREITSEAALVLARDGTDLEFLRLSLSRLSSGLSAEAEHALARRLLDLGFPDRARNLLLSEVGRDFAEERRYLRAESAVALDRPEDAIEELSGMSGERAARIRAGALAAMGDYGAALSAGAALPEADDMTESAWRAGAWAQLEGSDDPVLSETANTMAAPATATGSGLPSLSAGRDALDAAEESRGMIDRLLQRFPTEPESGS